MVGGPDGGLEVVNRRVGRALGARVCVFVGWRELVGVSR